MALTHPYAVCGRSYGEPWGKSPAYAPNVRLMRRSSGPILAMLLLALTAGAARSAPATPRSDAATEAQCRPYFHDACSEAMGRWLPGLGEVSLSPSLGTTRIGRLDDFRYERGRAPTGDLDFKGPSDGTFFVFGNAGRRKGGRFTITCITSLFTMSAVALGKPQRRLPMRRCRRSSSFVATFSRSRRLAAFGSGKPKRKSRRSMAGRRSCRFRDIRMCASYRTLPSCRLGPISAGRRKRSFSANTG